MNEIDQEIQNENEKMIAKLAGNGEKKLIQKEREKELSEAIQKMAREKDRMDLLSRMRRYIPEPFKNYLQCQELFNIGPDEAFLNQFYIAINGFCPIGIRFIRNEQRTYLAKFVPYDRRLKQFRQDLFINDIEIALAIAKRQFNDMQEEEIRKNQPVYVDFEMDQLTDEQKLECIARLLRIDLGQCW